jgi:hypothetical protein
MWEKDSNSNQGMEIPHILVLQMEILHLIK